jgi:hypothetical protein
MDSSNENTTPSVKSLRRIFSFLSIYLDSWSYTRNERRSEIKSEIRWCTSSTTEYVNEKNIVESKNHNFSIIFLTV